MPADGTITLNGGFSVSANVDVMIQGVNRLYFKQHSHAFGDLISIDNLKIDAKQGDEIFVSLYGPTGQSVAVFGGIHADNGDTLPLTISHRDLSFGDEVQCKGTDDPMSGGHHNWYYGYYDGENQFDERQIAFPYDADQKLIKAYRLAMPATETVAVGTKPVPVWSGSGGAYISVSSDTAGIPVAVQRPTRTANGGASPSSGPGGSDSLRHAITWNFDINAAAGISVNWDHGQTEADHDFFDFNGDHYPDHVDNGGTVSFLRIPTPGHTENAYFEPRPIVGLNNTFDGSDNDGNAFPLRVIDHGTIAIGIGDNLPIANKTDPSGDRSTSVSLGFSASGKYGISSTSTDWIDVNGDGLPDQVQRVPSGDSNNPFVVKLNYGYRMGSPMKTAAVNWDTSQLHYGSTVTDDLNQAFGSAGLLNFAGSKVGLNAIRAQDSGGFAGALSAGAGNSGSSGSYSGGVGVGFNYTASRTLIDVIDVNGDGLPDQVMKLPGEDQLHVRLNRGADFDPNEMSWYLPAAWPAANNEPTDDGIYSQLGTLDDGLSYDRAKSFNVGVNVKYCFWFICVGVDAFYANADTYGDVKLQDIDGDGLPDMVLKRPGDQTIYVKRNRLNSEDDGSAHPVNVLKAVHRPLGSTIALTYKRMGNLRTDATSGLAAVDMPTAKYVMASADIDDNFGNHYKQTFDHNPDGFFDRLERDDYGFATVITTKIDNANGPYTTTTDNYFNTDFYRKGLRTQTITRDSAGNVWTGAQSFYAQPDDATLNAVRAGSFFPSKQSENTYWYEGETTDASAPRKTRTSVYSRYDAVGNLTDFIEYNDDDADDDVYYHVDYSNDQNLLSQHIYRASEVQAHAAAQTGTLLRDRRATYESHGALQTLTNVLVGGKDPTSGQPYTGATNPTWTFSYDGYGNLVEEVDPRQYTLNYTYDDTAQTYRTHTVDSFGLTSSSTPNYAFGAPQVVTDTNDNTEVYSFDEFGRVSTVYGPNDVPAPDGTDFCGPHPPTQNEPTIAFCYSRGAIDPASPIPPTPPSQPEYAITHHKDIQHPGDPVVTSTFVDGLERVIQTKKDLDRDVAGSTQTGMTASGAIGFDGVGRLVTQNQPSFDPSGDPTLYYRPTAGPGHITRFEYDPLDRKKKVTTPDGAKTTMAYTFGTLDGVRRLLTVTSDANVNSNAPWGTVHQTFTDLRGLVLGVLQRNRVNTSSTPTDLLTRYAYDDANELVKVTDAKGNVTTAEYDTVGHMVALNSPDAGRTEWRYDLSGNVGAKETANLRKQSQLILYDHQFNRLRTIVYPVSPAVSYVYGDSSERGTAFANVAGRIKREISEAGQRDYQYDRLGNIAQEHWLLHSIKWKPGTDYEHTTAYTHDSFDRLLTVDFGDSSHEVVAYNYDHGGNVTNVVGTSTNPQGTTTYVSHVGYDEFESRTRLVYGNGIVTTYQYDPLTRRLTNINADERDPALVSRNLPPRPFQRLVYGYDLVGNVTQIRNDAPFDDTIKGPVLLGTVNQNFTYDDLYQLKRAAGSYQEQSGSHNDYSLTFNYDEIGNILRKTQTNDIVSNKSTNPIVATTYDATYTYGGLRPHAPTEIDETAPQGNKTTVFQRGLSYDENGNQAGWLFAANQRRQTSWNEENRIQLVTSNNVELARALYNGDGERAVNWQQDNPWYEIAYFGSNVTLRNGTYATRHVFLGDLRIASKMDDQRGGKTPTTVYFHDDDLGSANFLTDSSQALLEHEEYLPTGELWVDEADRRFLDRPAYLFNGKELDSGTGLYYYGARHYDPHLSQWNSPDPILNQYFGGTPNDGVFRPANLGLFTYTHNNPVNYVDPKGTDVIGRYELQEMYGKCDSCNRITPTEKRVYASNLDRSRRVLPVRCSTHNRRHRLLRVAIRCERTYQ